MKLITTEEVAHRIGVDPSTIRRWRTAHRKTGPPFIRLSDRVTLYNVDDVQEWLARHRVDPEAA